MNWKIGIILAGVAPWWSLNPASCSEWGCVSMALPFTCSDVPEDGDRTDSPGPGSVCDRPPGDNIFLTPGGFLLCHIGEILYQPLVGFSYWSLLSRGPIPILCWHMGLLLPGHRTLWLCNVPITLLLQPALLLCMQPPACREWCPTSHWRRRVRRKDQNENKRVTQTKHHVELLSLTCQIHEVIQGETSTMTVMELMAICAIITQWTNHHVVLEKVWKKN